MGTNWDEKSFIENTIFVESKSIGCFLIKKKLFFFGAFLKIEK